MTPAIDAALAVGHEVHVLTKPATRALLEPAYPGVTWIEWTAPWTAHRGKYHLWKWNWRELISTVKRLRSERYTDGWSARVDPRDHFLLWLASAKQRRSFRHAWSRPFINAGLDWPSEPRHRSEDWRALALDAGLMPTDRPTLSTAAYAGYLPRELNQLPRPWICLHTGAAQATRRWPEANWLKVITALRKESDFSLMLIPDPSGHGEALRGYSEVTIDSMALPVMAAILSASDIVLAHDSGPAHIASALDTPVFAVMGPNLPERFGPNHPQAAVLHDPQCPHFPCRDFCHYDEPRCLTRLSPELCIAKLKPWAEELLRDAEAASLHVAND